MKPPFHRRLTPISAPTGGSTLVPALFTVTVFSLVAANVLLSVSSRYNSAYRSASWNEALTTAEAGVDAMAAQISRVVPSVVPGVSDLGPGYSQPSPSLLGDLQIGADGTITSRSVTVGPLKDATLLSVATLDFYHGGEGSSHQQAVVAVQLKLLSALLPNGTPTVQDTLQKTLDSVKSVINRNDLPLLRLVSTGTVDVPGGRVAGPSRQDNDLWRVALFTDPNTHATVSQPQVSRRIEMYLRPVFAFDSAVASNDWIQAANPGTIFDSFNSASPLASTDGKYNSLKRTANATVRANGAAVSLGGKVYGNVNTNGGNIAQDSHVTGKVNNASYCPLPIVTAPTWNGDPLSPSSITGSTSLAAGTVLLPSRYRFNGITGSLHITRGLLGTGTNVEIFVDGNVTGSIEVDPGITAKLYVSGSLTTNASQLKNGTGIAANLQIYGVPSSTGGSPLIFVSLDAPLCAAIYAPLHRIGFKGSGDVSGAAVGGTVAATDELRLHYDESLAYAGGIPLVRYQAASWKEITTWKGITD